MCGEKIGQHIHREAILLCTCITMIDYAFICILKRIYYDHDNLIKLFIFQTLLKVMCLLRLVNR